MGTDAAFAPMATSSTVNSLVLNGNNCLEGMTGSIPIGHDQRYFFNSNADNTQPSTRSITFRGHVPDVEASLVLSHAHGEQNLGPLGNTLHHAQVHIGTPHSLVQPNTVTNAEASRAQSTPDMSSQPSRFHSHARIGPAPNNLLENAPYSLPVPNNSYPTAHMAGPPLAHAQIPFTYSWSPPLGGHGPTLPATTQQVNGEHLRGQQGALHDQHIPQVFNDSRHPTLACPTISGSPYQHAFNSNYFNAPAAWSPRPHAGSQLLPQFYKAQGQDSFQPGPHVPQNAHLDSEPYPSKSDALVHYVQNPENRNVNSSKNYFDNPPSYAQVVCPPPIHPPEVAAPTKKGDYFVVHIDEELYRQQSEICKQSYIGKVSYAPGEKPHPLPDLKNQLRKIWKMKGELRIAHLGKGYYNIRLDSPEERKWVGARSSWNMAPGVIRLSSWKPGFNPYKINSSTTQVWLRIYELPFEFWHKSVITSIAKVVGNPIKIDERSLDGSVGHYVRVLVEVDLAAPFHMEVMVDGPDYCDLVHLHFENLTLYCPNCNLVGHSVTNCYKLKRKDGDKKPSSSTTTSSSKSPSRGRGRGTTTSSSKSPSRGRGRGRHRSSSRLVYRVVDKSKDDVIQQDITPTIVATKNSFEVLAEQDSTPDNATVRELSRQVPGEQVHVRANDNLTLHISSDETHPIQTEQMASSSTSTPIPFAQNAPKSILKKPRKVVTDVTHTITEAQAPDPSTGHQQSWADLVDDNLRNKLGDALALHTNTRGAPSCPTEAQSEFTFSRYTQEIVDQVRSKAVTNFRIQRPTAAAGQAMRLMVTKNWSGENDTSVEPSLAHHTFPGDKIPDNLPGDKIPSSQ